jgi:hypothetical protein
MRVISMPRRGGKTTAMLRWMQEAPEGETRVMACFSEQESMRLLRLSREQGLGLESWQFVSAKEARHLSGHPFRGRVVLGLDNLDIWLSSHFGREVVLGTITEGEP